MNHLSTDRDANGGRKIPIPLERGHTAPFVTELLRKRIQLSSGRRIRLDRTLKCHQNVSNDPPSGSKCIQLRGCPTHNRQLYQRFNDSANRGEYLVGTTLGADTTEAISLPIVGDDRLGSLAIERQSKRHFLGLIVLWTEDERPRTVVTASLHTRWERGQMVRGTTSRTDSSLCQARGECLGTDLQMNRPIDRFSPFRKILIEGRRLGRRPGITVQHEARSIGDLPEGELVRKGIGNELPRNDLASFPN